MLEKNKKKFEESLRKIYKEERLVKEALRQMEACFANDQEQQEKKPIFTQEDSVLITYGDTLYEGEKPGLQVLYEFLVEYVQDAIDTVHILPMYPYTSDDGFSVVDYLQIEPSLGTWEDIEKLAGKYHLMFDAVINHISQKSEWFQKYLQCEKPYIDYFITADATQDYQSVTRPRALPLLTPVETKEGKKYVWTTFSEDQIDLNFQCIEVLVKILDILVQYARHGAKFIRLDAIGFLWKELGTSCMHLPETHEVIKLARKVLETYAPRTFLITETNVPHKDNMSYFGNGKDEAHLIYQFPLPPLTMFSLRMGNVKKLSEWVASLKPVSEETTFFNFLSSHDGIGIRPTEGILTASEQQFLVEATLKSGGVVSYKDNGDGSKSPYELNINYQDAMASAEESDEVRIKRFLVAETILLSLQGVPGIYIHSLLGSRNDYVGEKTSGIPRRINREKLELTSLKEELNQETQRSTIFRELTRRLKIRKEQSAFSPIATQKVQMFDERIFTIVRRHPITKETIQVFINVSIERVVLYIEGLEGVDLLQGEKIGKHLILEGLESKWVLSKQSNIVEKGEAR